MVNWPTTSWHIHKEPLSFFEMWNHDVTACPQSDLAKGLLSDLRNLCAAIPEGKKRPDMCRNRFLEPLPSRLLDQSWLVLSTQSKTFDRLEETSRAYQQLIQYIKATWHVSPSTNQKGTIRLHFAINSLHCVQSLHTNRSCKQEANLLQCWRTFSAVQIWPLFQFMCIPTPRTNPALDYLMTVTSMTQIWQPVPPSSVTSCW